MSEVTTRAESYERRKQDEQSLSNTAEYVVNLDSARVHRRFKVQVGGRGKFQMADFPRCNLDDMVNRRDVKSREEVVALLEGRTPRPCKRCFPDADEEAERMNDVFAPERDDDNPGSAPDEEVVAASEMDPEDRP